MGGTSVHMWAIFSHIFALKWPKIWNFCVFFREFYKIVFRGNDRPRHPKGGPRGRRPPFL